eukprot:851798-Rhodomonas_salina.1
MRICTEASSATPTIAPAEDGITAEPLDIDLARAYHCLSSEKKLAFSLENHPSLDFPEDLAGLAAGDLIDPKLGPGVNLSANWQIHSSGHGRGQRADHVPAAVQNLATGPRCPHPGTQTRSQQIGHGKADSNEIQGIKTLNGKGSMGF